MNDFAAFRILWNAIPTSEQAYGLICECLGWYVVRCGKSLEAVERCLALYKPKTETKKE